MKFLNNISEFKIPLGFFALGIICLLISIGLFTNFLSNKTYSLKLYSGMVTALGAILLALITFVFDKGSSDKSTKILENVEGTKPKLDTIESKTDTTIAKIGDLQNENIALKFKLIEIQDVQIKKNKEIIGLTQKVSDLSEANLNLNLKQSEVIQKIKNPLPEEIQISFSCSFKLDEISSLKFREKYKDLYPNEASRGSQLSAFDFNLFRNILDAQQRLYNIISLTFAHDFSVETNTWHVNNVVCKFDNADKIVKGYKLNNISTLYGYYTDEFEFIYENISLQRNRRLYKNENLTDNSILELENTNMILSLNGSNKVKITHFALKSKELNLDFDELSSSANPTIFSKKINIK